MYAAYNLPQKNAALSMHILSIDIKNLILYLGSLNSRYTIILKLEKNI